MAASRFNVENGALLYSGAAIGNAFDAESMP